MKDGESEREERGKELTSHCSGRRHWKARFATTGARRGAMLAQGVVADLWPPDLALERHAAIYLSAQGRSWSTGTRQGQAAVASGGGVDDVNDGGGSGGDGKRIVPQEEKEVGRYNELVGVAVEVVLVVCDCGGGKDTISRGGKRLCWRQCCSRSGRHSQIWSLPSYLMVVAESDTGGCSRNLVEMVVVWSDRKSGGVPAVVAANREG